MIYTIKPKRQNEKLTLELNASDVDNLKHLIFHANKTTGSWADETQIFVDILNKTVKDFQGENE